MLIREYTPADLDALHRMHASQGFDYAFPDLSDPIFISKLILEDDSGRPVMAALARLTCEMYLLIDRAAAPKGVVIPNQAAPSADEGRAPGSTASRAREISEGSAVSAHDENQKQIPRSSGRPLQNQERGESRPSARDDSESGPSRARAGNARTHWAQLLALHRAGEQDLLARGLDDAHAWLPPQIAKRFGRRLESLGWLRDDTWTPYYRRLKP
jgi:hypothetical protein